MSRVLKLCANRCITELRGNKMKYEDYYYYKVDVMSRSHGYSFMVRCKDELSDEEVISRASKADCFEDEADSDNAYVDSYLVDSDIRAFKDCTTTV
jgi:hypothetical protein